MDIVSNECPPSLVFDLGGVVFDWNPKALLNDLRRDIGFVDEAMDLLHQAVFQDYGLGSDWISFDRGLIRTNVLASRIAIRLEAGIGKADYGLGEDEDQTIDPRDKLPTALRAQHDRHLTDMTRQQDARSDHVRTLTDQIHQWLNSIGPRLLPMPETVAMLQHLHNKGYRLLFLSNMPTPFIEHLQCHRDIFCLFTDGIFSSEIGYVKPETAFFNYAKERFDQGKQARYVFFDDNEVNIAAARSIGWKAVHFKNASQASSEIGERPLGGLKRKAIRSYVVRAGRMGSGQSKALETLAPRYLIPFEVPAEKDRIGPSAQASTPEDDKLASYWPTKYHDAPLIIEIGFGMGDALATIAGQDRSKRYLGIDVHPPGVGSMLQLIERHNLDHVRLIQYDAVKVLSQMIAAHSVAGFHIYFPDPWPKKRHHKRRLIQRDFVKLMASRLKVGGYIHCATDWEPYAQSMLEVLSAESGLANLASGYHERPAWRPMTKFEARGLSLGHTVNDLLFRKQ